MRRKSSVLFRIFSLFLIWRLILFVIAFISVFLIPKYGGRFPYVDRALSVTGLPNWIWGFGGFDGVHYLRIAQDGYIAVYSPAFFPVFPILIRFLALFFPKDPFLDTAIYIDPSFFYAGIIIANFSFLFALYFLYKFFRIDFGPKTSWLAVVFLLLFPTSFYFGAIYTESLFLLLSVLTLYCVRKKNFFLAGVFSSIASATRFAGIFLVSALLLELYLSVVKKEIKVKSKKFFFSVLGILISPFGLLAYMVYLWKNFDDPFYFVSAQPYFGAERSSSIILLPQVIYRYVKIFLNVPAFSLQFFNSLLEFVFSLGILFILFALFKKIRFSYWIFIFLSIITPTLTGSFSSMPRYVLMAFPLLPALVNVLDKHRKLVFVLSAILGVVLVSLFVRGYWVA